MKTLLIVVGVSLFLFLVAIVFRSSRWKTIMSATGSQADELQEKHAYLNNEGFRCRLRVEENQPVAGFSNSGFNPGNHRNVLAKLQVHEEDVKNAAEALDRFERERVRSQTPIL